MKKEDSILSRPFDRIIKAYVIGKTDISNMIKKKKGSDEIKVKKTETLIKRNKNNDSENLKSSTKLLDPR